MLSIRFEPDGYLENGERVMRFGVHLGPQDLSIGEMRGAWRRFEELGFDWISIWDHFYSAAPPFDGQCFEALTSHAALALETTRVRVGSLVYSTGYRHPTLLAKAGATIDHLSDGRLEMGLGAGWHRVEYDAYGLPFEAPAVRLRRMVESVTIIRALWSQPTVDFEGEFFTLKQARCDPKPLQSPPRIWIGAHGPRALALAGQYGDGWNGSYFSPEEFRTGLEIVKANAGSRPMVVGVNLGLIGDVDEKDREAFLVQRFGPETAPVQNAFLAGPPAEVIDRLGQYASIGADWVNIAVRAPIEMEVLETFATDVMPAFRE
jgi:alkanesulfonate monooxygenase SsuD/methylene tetrahydromethanopterin reductase-like flavin-dependent oxidoreductase (luciferase family)